MCKRDTLIQLCNNPLDIDLNDAIDWTKRFQGPAFSKGQEGPENIHNS